MISVMQRASGSVSSGSIADLVDSLTGVIEQPTALLLAGKQVRVIENNEALTTQAAADLLNVSRPHRLKLLETGQILQLSKVGRHRRLARAAVLKYKRKRDIKRVSALQALATISRRHTLGY
jgi:excisionase family DNA binding protein